LGENPIRVAFNTTEVPTRVVVFACKHRTKPAGQFGGGGGGGGEVVFHVIGTMEEIAVIPPLALFKEPMLA
jgi:hypothetical protein